MLVDSCCVADVMYQVVSLFKKEKSKKISSCAGYTAHSRCRLTVYSVYVVFSAGVREGVGESGGDVVDAVLNPCMLHFAIVGFYMWRSG